MSFGYPMHSDRSSLELGKSAYLLYERGSTTTPAHLWQMLIHGRLPFFLADTRTEREGRTVLNAREAKIMSDTQFTRLCGWLVDPELAHLPKFIMTASAVLPRRLVMRDPGHPRIRRLGWISNFALCSFRAYMRQIQGVVFLSGDEHLSSLVRASVRCGGKQANFHSIHSSSLFAPFPFANGLEDDFIAQDFFSFQSKRHLQSTYRCEANTAFFAGDGFAVLAATEKSANWSLQIDFHSEAGLKPIGSQTILLI
jgi:hypothetical protein